MMRRIQVSARLRFEVLKRDSHRCQYCGAAAPFVQLEVDHIVPVVAGGTNRPDNLITACRRCNAGKSAIELDDRLPGVAAQNDHLIAEVKDARLRAMEDDLGYLNAFFASRIGIRELSADEKKVVWECWRKFGDVIVEDAFDASFGMPDCEGRAVFTTLMKSCQWMYDDIQAGRSVSSQVAGNA